MVKASIVGLASGFPSPVAQEDVWRKYFQSHYQQSPLARRIFDHSGISTRHAAVEPYVEDVSQWSTQQRMQRYLPEAIGLGKSVVQSALDSAGISASDIGQLVVAYGLSCCNTQPRNCC
jgi:alkylresorcinol/alkylpyrone synthase